MENTETTNVVSLDTLNANNLPELQGWKDKQLKLVEENPYIDIEDNKTYEVAKQRRTALLKGRTSLEAQDKLIASKLTNFRKQVSSVTAELIEISKPHEEKQQEEVKRYEAVKEAEKAEKERLERERIEAIKNKISELENQSIQTVNSLGEEALEYFIVSKFKGMDTDFDFEEFDILYQQARTRVQEHCENKIKSLHEKKNQRLENERLAREKAEADAKLKAIQDQQVKERLEREEKERKEKEIVFEVRKNRLIEIGFRFNEELQKFFYDDKFITISKLKSTIFNTDVIDFENVLNDFKNSIQDAEEKHKKEQQDKEDREKAEIEAKKKADKENKAREKRLANDKKHYKLILLGAIDSFPNSFELAENKEVKEFSINASNRVTYLFNELLTELKEL